MGEVGKDMFSRDLSFWVAVEVFFSFGVGFVLSKFCMALLLLVEVVRVSEVALACEHYDSVYHGSLGLTSVLRISQVPPAFLPGIF